MISPELLRRYPFFNFMTQEQLKEVAKISDDIQVPKGATLFQMDEPAEALYLLVDGEVDLHYVVLDKLKTGIRQDFHVGTIDPGHLVGISALIEPYQLTATAVVTEPSRLVRIDAQRLRDLEHRDHDLAYGLQKKIAQATMERLHSARVELLAANSEAAKKSNRPGYAPA